MIGGLTVQREKSKSLYTKVFLKDVSFESASDYPYSFLRLALTHSILIMYEVLYDGFSVLCILYVSID